jgi:predicted transcriptional regulator
MERHIQDHLMTQQPAYQPVLPLDWLELVAEAKRRRKSYKVSQRRLAVIAEVSQPTLSRFELGKQDIQLSSALKILEALGMVKEGLK